MFISAHEAVRHLTVPRAIAAVEAALREQGQGIANLTGTIGWQAGNLLSLAGAVLSGVRIMAARIRSEEGVTFAATLALFSDRDGSPLATVDGAAFTEIAQAAATAVAADHLAHPDAAILAISGTGLQAEILVEAMLEVRDLQEVVVVGGDPAVAASFAWWVAERFGVLARPAADPEAAADADIIVTTASSALPTFPTTVKPDAFVALVAPDRPDGCPIEDALLRRAGRLIVERRPKAGRDGSCHGPSGGKRAADRIEELADIVTAGEPADRPARQSGPVLFKPAESGLADMALAHLAYRLSTHAGDLAELAR